MPIKLVPVSKIGKRNIGFGCVFFGIKEALKTRWKVCSFYLTIVKLK